MLTNKIAILEVETIQLVTRLLRVHNIFVNNKRCTLSSIGSALPDLSVLRISAGVSEIAWMRGIYRIGPNFPKRSKSSSGVTL